MKLSQKIILFLSLTLTLIAVQAQPPGGGRGGRNMDPTQMATRQTEQMTELLTLEDSQQEEVQAINLKYAEKMKSIRDEMRSGGQDVDRMAMMGMMTDLRAERGKEFKGILTKEQYKTWKKEEMRRQEEWQNRSGGGPGPGGE